MTIAALTFLAVVQIIVHLVFFLHLNTSSEQSWNLMCFIFAAATVVYLITAAPEAPYPFSLFLEETTLWKAMAQTFKYFCILFVFIFQFLRWKDSR